MDGIDGWKNKPNEPDGRGDNLMGILSGIRVIDLSRLLPGPYATMILADHGADVIAIEDPRYAVEALEGNMVNRNKRHMTLNLKSEKGREIFFTLVKDADVLVEGFRPGVTRRLGVDYKSVSGINPGIVYCSISGYGQTGPLRNMAGHDVNYLSFAGVLDLIGEANRPPCIPGIQIADMAAGGMNAVIGILLALLSRTKTGKGEYIDISMTDGALSFLSLVLSLRQVTGMPVKRSDSFLSHRYACYNVYETKDGRFISIGAVENRFWKNLCNHFGVPGFVPLQYDDTRREEIINFFKKRFLEKTLNEWKEELGQMDICWAPVQNMDEVLNDQLFVEREMIINKKEQNGKEMTLLGIPVKISGNPGGVKSLPPGFGEHTREILSSLGYSDSEIEKLQKEGVI